MRRSFVKFFKIMKFLVYLCLINSSLMASPQAVERAIRPDALQLGDPLFGPEKACTAGSVTCCTPDNPTTRGCAATVIVETGFPQTLTLSGTYCLGTDLVNPLTIAGDSITLDMNGHTIFVPGGDNGITIPSGFTDIRIHSGLLDGQLLGDNVGISIAGEAVRIENVTCFDFIFSDNFAAGISTLDAANIV